MCLMLQINVCNVYINVSNVTNKCFQCYKSMFVILLINELKTSLELEKSSTLRVTSLGVP